LQADWLDQNGQPLPDIDDAYAQSYLNGDAYVLENWENPDQYDPSREIEDSGSGGYRNDEALFSRDLDSDDRVSQGDADEVRSRSIDSVPAQQATEPSGLQEARDETDFRYEDVAKYYEWLGLEDQAGASVMERELSGPVYDGLPQYLKARQGLIEHYTGTTEERSEWKRLEKDIGRIRNQLEDDLRTFEVIAESQAADNERVGAYMQETSPRNGRSGKALWAGRKTSRQICRPCWTPASKSCPTQSTFRPCVKRNLKRPWSRLQAWLRWLHKSKA
jgi:hypothetical protein